ncbi:MAG: transcriptional regulator SlyA [Firmicutes bacterium ADurb.Bin262]|nr:MAG: transcriptional regulator SlyA [Firmicutes bacterium ADurb.Bin262]
MSRTLNRLEEKRYIERLADRGDRRNVCLKLTAAGEDAIHENMNKVKSFLEDALLYLSDDEIAQLTALFEKMYEAMKAQINKMEQDKENSGLC